MAFLTLQLHGMQVRFVIGESFYHAGPEETEEQLQEGETKNTHQTKSYMALN